MQDDVAVAGLGSLGTT